MSDAELDNLLGSLAAPIKKVLNCSYAVGLLLANWFF